MEALGFGPRILDWCGAYLRDRKFRVLVGDSRSSWGHCTSGATQGSEIAPQLFAIFVQDLRNILTVSNVHYKIYADDLKIYCSSKPDILGPTLQSAMNSVARWADENRMSISVPKCAVIKSKPDPTIYLLNNTPIPIVSSYKDLGVVWDSDLNFRSHVVEITRSTSRLSNMILRTFIIEDPSFYLQLYGSLIIPRLTYCSEIWRPAYQKDVLLLETSQRKFLARVAKRCRVDKSSLSIPSITELHNKTDVRAFLRLLKAHDFERFFSVRPSKSRAGFQILPCEPANSLLTDHAFA